MEEEEISKLGKISSNRKSRITRQQFKDRLAHFQKESSTEKDNSELVRRSKPRSVFSHIKEDAEEQVRLSSEFEDIEKDNTRKVSEKSKLLLIGTTKDIKSKYADLAVFRQPVCLVQNDENSKLSVERRIINEIATIDDPVNVIAIAGPYRSGKSYLLNRLANAQRGFRLGNTTDATTKGIWAWCLEHPERNGEVLLLLDSEGIGDVDKNSKFFCKKCVNPPRSFNHYGDCKRHLQTFHYGFMYQCTGCGKTNTRRPDREHDCYGKKSKYVLAHRESGLTGIDAIRKRQGYDLQIENEIAEEVNIIPKDPLSPIKETVLSASHSKCSNKTAFHPYKQATSVKNPPLSMPTFQNHTATVPPAPCCTEIRASGGHHRSSACTSEWSFSPIKTNLEVSLT